MGDRKILKLSEVVHATGINRNTLTSMYYDRAVRIELPVADKLCKYFNCTMNDLFEFKEEVEEKINLILRLIIRLILSLISFPYRSNTEFYKASSKTYIYFIIYIKESIE
jgi:putative transcriptional regulator